MLEQRVDDSSVPDQFRQVRPGTTAKSSVAAVGAQSVIGKSLVIKGEITGTESVQIDGTVEGTVMLPDDRVTIGAGGRVSADVIAQDIVVHGELIGDCEASEHLYVRREGSICGNIVAASISVEDGAYITGTIDIRRESKPTPKAEKQETAEQEELELAHVN